MVRARPCVDGKEVVEEVVSVTIMSRRPFPATRTSMRILDAPSRFRVCIAVAPETNFRSTSLARPDVTNRRSLGLR